MIDANFRLKRKAKDITDDPDLANGEAYFVEDKRYKDHLKRYLNENEVNPVLLTESQATIFW